MVGLGSARRRERGRLEDQALSQLPLASTLRDGCLARGLGARELGAGSVGVSSAISASALTCRTHTWALPIRRSPARKRVVASRWVSGSLSRRMYRFLKALPLSSQRIHLPGEGLRGEGARVGELLADLLQRAQVGLEGLPIFLAEPVPRRKEPKLISGRLVSKTDEALVRLLHARQPRPEQLTVGLGLRGATRGTRALLGRQRLPRLRAAFRLHGVQAQELRAHLVVGESLYPRRRRGSPGDRHLGFHGCTRGRREADGGRDRCDRDQR